MYYLNSDGTLDTSSNTDIENFSKCNCNTCLQKRKSSYKNKWFSWTNIILILIFIGIILFACNIEKICLYFYSSPSSSSYPTSSYPESTTTTTSSSSSDSTSNNKDFELPFL